MKRGSFIHPYMPNSAPENIRQMLKDLGVNCIEDIYRDLIPHELRFQGEMKLPEPILSECELKSHVEDVLSKNISCEEYTSFLGAGCYRHYVPAVCDEIANRSEFLTAYCGDTYSDHGKMQAIFEYTSMMGELLDMDVVSYTCYDGGQSVCSSLRMAIALGNGVRNELLVPSTMNPEIFSQLKEYCRDIAVIKTIAYNPDNGMMDMQDIKSQISSKTAAVFFENPSFLGFIEQNAAQIADLAHQSGALCVVMPEVASLGIMESPANYGADIVCGDIQPLGIHMQYGGGCAGFIAVQQEKRLIEHIPTYLYGIAPTANEGEYGWGRSLNERCSHGSRENANEYFGTESGLWAITAGVYLASMGPQGMKELGETIVQKTAYAIQKLSSVPKIKANLFGGCSFQEFIINFDDSGKTVQEINKKLLGYRIFGGKDISKDFPALGQSALYCVSEMTTTLEIENLAEALANVIGG